MKLLLIISLTILTTIVAFFVIGKRSIPLVSPVLKQNVSAKLSPTPQPTVFNNPPKEVKYDSQTDLKKELESIDPQVLDSDFE